MTALARVTAVAGRRFSLDRNLFAPASRSHRHPQPADRGTVWWQGSKRKLERASWRNAVLWHDARGAVPEVGETLQCHLDVERRLLASRAHTAMHIFLAALWAASGPALRRDPEVKGSGSFRLDLAAPIVPRDLAAVLERVRDFVAKDHRITRSHVARGAEMHGVDAQRFEPPDPFPGPATSVDVVRIGDVCSYPCDGTHVERTGKVGRIVIAQARAAAGGFTIVVKVA